MFKKNLLAATMVVACASAQAQTYDLDFAKQTATKQMIELNGTTIKYRAYENIPYVANPEDVTQQSLSVYIPEAYFKDKSIDGWIKETAPIFMPNSVGGYMPAHIEKPEISKRSGEANSLLVALSKG
ncbi:hypothetical protein [Actinobacillus vicugnae]|uniref:hypothetical protein n=1 Tax=Actinobacillus vicugnae TaxID=2573093 RepID=UPI0012415082|nr:hypothetical protein [Actinobacillus vicugnae]